MKNEVFDNVEYKGGMIGFDDMLDSNKNFLINLLQQRGVLIWLLIVCPNLVLLYPKVLQKVRVT